MLYFVIFWEQKPKGISTWQSCLLRQGDTNQPSFDMCGPLTYPWHSYSTLTCLNDSSASRTPIRCYTALQNALRYFGALTKYCSQLHIQWQVVRCLNFLFYRPTSKKSSNNYLNVNTSQCLSLSPHISQPGSSLWREGRNIGKTLDLGVPKC